MIGLHGRKELGAVTDCLCKVHTCVTRRALWTWKICAVNDIWSDQFFYRLKDR